MKLATFNVNSIKVRLPILLNWLSDTKVDAIALQETKTVDESFPLDEIAVYGYDAFYHGQKTYNGVALLVKKHCFTSVELVQKNLPYYPDDQARAIAVRLITNENQPLLFIGCYFPNGQAVGSDKYLYKLDWIASLTDWVKSLRQQGERVILAGDMNIAPRDSDVWDPAAWAGNILVSAPEREAYARLVATGLTDTWLMQPHPAQSYTWWDYRYDGYQKNHGLRIDHFLVDSLLAPKVLGVEIDKRPREEDKPSDHTPVILTLDL